MGEAAFQALVLGTGHRPPNTGAIPKTSYHNTYEQNTLANTYGTAPITTPRTTAPSTTPRTNHRTNTGNPLVACPTFNPTPMYNLMDYLKCVTQFHGQPGELYTFISSVDSLGPLLDSPNPITKSHIYRHESTNY